MSKKKTKELIMEAFDYLQGYLVDSDVIHYRIDIKKARIKLKQALEELEEE